MYMSRRRERKARGSPRLASPAQVMQMDVAVTRIVGRVACTLAIVSLATAAEALLPPDAYLNGRQSAENHVQIGIQAVSPPQGGMGRCALTGRIVQVFRGSLVRGQEVKFDVSCYRYGQLPIGETLWTDYDALAGARYVEAFMTGAPEPKVVLDQVEIILQPREWPYCAADSLSCESSGAFVEEMSCGFFDRAFVLWGLIGSDCGAGPKDSAQAPTPALRMPDEP